MHAVTRRMKVAPALVLLTLLFGGVWFYRVREQTVRQEVKGELSALAAAIRYRKPALNDQHTDLLDPIPHISIVASLLNGDGQTPGPVSDAGAAGLV